MKLNEFDPLDYLKTEEDCRLALVAAYEEDPGDGSLIAATLGDIAKARGMSQLAKETGLSRENLYRSLSGKGRPEFATILKVSKALGFNMAPVAQHA
jgi:probable addiction module antidote protein